MSSPATTPAVGTDVATRTFPPARAPRGLVLVVPGRGDNADHYERFGARLAFDGYTVVVPESPVTSADGVAELWRTAVDAGTAAGTDYPITLVVGVDVAASFVASATASGTVHPTALVFAGAVATGAASASASASGTSAGAALDADAEIAQRTSCPVHSAVLRGSSAVALSADTTVAAWPSDGSIDESALTLPTLILHGESDAISSVDDVVDQTASFTDRTLLTLVGGVHDVLNDINHRTVAAEIVSFAERLRISPDAAPVVTRRSLVNA